MHASGCHVRRMKIVAASAESAPRRWRCMDGSLQRLSFRVRHDCPLAEASRAVPGVDLEVWSGHRFELVSARAPSARQQALRAAWHEHLRPERVIAFHDGVMALWRPRVKPKASISRRLERHGLLWMQPLRVRDGWEYFDAFAFDDAGARAAIAELRTETTVRLVRRERVGPDAIAASLFVSLHGALEAPTDKQAEAIVAAFAAGYYRSPRGATTADVAGIMGLGRSAFEERLRGGENRLMADLAPALHQARPHVAPS